MTKKQDPRAEAQRPPFDTDVPFPTRGKVDFWDANSAYPIEFPEFSISYCLASMQVGESFLASNYATTSVDYAKKKYKFEYTRELQADGSVRIWRTA